MRNQYMGPSPSRLGLHIQGSGYFVLDYTQLPRKETTRFMLAFGKLEWSFVAVLVILVGAAGLFAMFLVLQLFRGHFRR